MTNVYPSITINKRKIGSGHPTYIVAEMSANHNQSFEKAVKIIKAAKSAGADAIKLQTYTPDSITLKCDNKYFLIKDKSWCVRTLYDLYSVAYTPWEWHEKLKQVAEDLELDFFSTPFDPKAVELLTSMDVPAYKIASFELIDHQLLKLIARTRKPIILSTGMATLGEIEEALNVIFESGGEEAALLKCTSAYPAPPQEMNLKTIPHLWESFKVPVGLSDHTLGHAVALTAVALGACMVEKHLTLARADGGPDSTFSMEPDEFKAMVQNIRTAEKALGVVTYEITEKQMANRLFRRSLFAVVDISKGELLTKDNIRSIRPSCGLKPKFLSEILGKKARKNIKRGTPMAWHLIE